LCDLAVELHRAAVGRSRVAVPDVSEKSVAFLRKLQRPRPSTR
jgi:hypothetical protein